MKRRILVSTAVVSLAMAAACPASAYDGAFFDLFKIPFSAHEAALGGTHVAEAEGVSTLVSNPAGFRSVDPELSIATVTVSIYDAAPSMLDQIVTSQPDITPGIQRSTVNLLGPLGIAYVGNGLGFGLFNSSNARTWTWGAYPAGRAVLMENLVLIAGYAFRIPLPDAWASTLDVGLSFPVFLAARSDAAVDIRGVFSGALAPLDVVMSQPFSLSSGIGIEAGILYSWSDTFFAGLAFRDLAMTTWESFPSLASYLAGTTTVARNVPLPLDVSFGVRWTPRIKNLFRSVDGLSIMADYGDIFDWLIYPPGATNPLLHIGLGAELTLLQIVKLRLGFYQLLPSGGIALDLSFITIEAAVFGRELSAQPWGYPVYGYMASVRVRL